MRWLALTLRAAMLVFVRAVEARYRLRAGTRCPRCGWRSEQPDEGERVG